ncbi:MAG: alpha-mannosidase [Actinobacteria bacterium]|nr:alpha-mannosidase [Actinomycetota bacterium]
MPSPNPTAREVIVVPHTHWDREWYSPFQTFRMNLVDLVDRLLPLLENDPGFAHFQLDGQMAVVDDYLEIRPHEEARLRSLAASGRVSMGPWYILMDEFLVSGETMVRDLRLGIEKAAAFGGAMATGYLPDMFGHIAQMPQLLRQFGFENAVVWRGVPAVIDTNAFEWSAPDGSTVRAEYLLDGYGNGAFLPDDAKELVAMIRRYLAMFETFISAEAPILWMNGTDHLFPKAWLSRVIAEANEIQDDFSIRVGSLDDYVAIAPTSGLPSWTGELRSSARSNLLMGVASNRVDVKQAAAAAERVLERVAEPASALFLPPEQWPQTFLDEAWRHMICNAAHDSICACSDDEVNLAVVHRFQEARQIGDGLSSRAAKALAKSMANAGPVVINTTSRARGGVIELVLPGHDEIAGTQLVKKRGGPETASGLRRADVASLALMAMNNMHELYDVTIDEADDDERTLSIDLHIDPEGRRPKYAGDAADRVMALAGELPDGPTTISLVRPQNQRVLAYASDVPGFGWSRWSPGTLPVDEVSVGATDDETITMRNGLVEVVVDASTGLFSVNGLEGFGTIVDDGDSGDTYNYNPPLGDKVVREPASVSVRVVERGPVRARVEVERQYVWPHRVVKQQRVGEREVATVTTIEVRAGSALVWVTTEIDNRCEDHRVRAHVPLPSPATVSRAECAFAIVDRGLEAEGGLTERGLPTYPCRRFVQAGGLTVVHDGLLEYELIDIDGSGPGAAASTLALTLLRCTGVISQGPMTYRPAPAGPMTKTPGAQMLGRQVSRYAIALGGDRNPYELADEAFTPLLVHHARGGGSREDRGAALAVSGAEVSAVVREGGQLTIRVFNPTAAPTDVHIDGRRGWLVDLRGQLVEAFEGSFSLDPWKIATVQLAEL